MVRVRRANQGTRQPPSIRETSHRIRRNRRTRRLPQITVSPDNEIIEPTPSTISQSSPIPEIIEIGSQLPEELSDFILETEERSAEIAQQYQTNIIIQRKKISILLQAIHQ